jgi:HPt (histidine-containing phosphotransfer) domain-containing protein
LSHSPSPSTPEPLWLTEAKRVYIASLPEKLSNLHTLLAALDQDRSDAKHRELYDAFHRIEGSAASYDCDRLGEIAAECSELLSANRPLSQQDIDALGAQLSQLAEAADRAASAAPSPKLRSVLVVDDEPAAQATLQRLLEREGFAVLRRTGPPSKRPSLRSRTALGAHRGPRRC